MAWTAKTVNEMLVASETYTLPSSATTEYSTVIKDVKPNFHISNRKIGVQFNASAVSGTNLDIALYGSLTEDGASKFLLLDAVVADITATGVNSATIDLNAYPAPYYFLAWTSDADESANTIAVSIYG